MLTREDIQGAIEFIKEKYPRFPESENFWWKALGEYDVPQAWFHRTVQAQVLDGEKPPSATELRRKARSYVESEKTRREYSKKREPQKAHDGLVRILKDWRAGKPFYEHVDPRRAHKLGESMSILKADYAVMVLGLIATDQLKQGKTLEEVYQIALSESRGWTNQRLLDEVKRYYGYQQKRAETRIVEADTRELFDGLTSQILKERTGGNWASW